MLFEPEKLSELNPVLKYTMFKFYKARIVIDGILRSLQQHVQEPNQHTIFLFDLSLNHFDEIFQHFI